MKPRLRSPRAGWCAIELRDGRWHVAAEGDRDIVQAWYAGSVRRLTTLPLGCPGHAVATLDAHGQARDRHPAFPRRVLADGSRGSRVEWPATKPGPEGAEAELYRPVPRAEAP